jgi:hypothetical protein
MLMSAIYRGKLSIAAEAIVGFSEENVKNFLQGLGFLCLGLLQRSTQLIL